MIEVLVATYNGAGWLDEQLVSILGQSLPPDRVSIRDDGSTDRTPALIGELEKKDSRVRVVRDGAGRQGASQNFSRLLEQSSGDYVLLSDQDDVWRPNKIERLREAMSGLEARFGPDAPLLVYSDAQIIDANGGLQSDSFWRRQGLAGSHGMHFESVLMQNVAPGCTMLLNRPLARIVCPIPHEAVMHDWWILLTAAALGHVQALDDRLVCYRLHGENAIGADMPDLYSSARRFVRDNVSARRRIRIAFEQALLQAEAFHDRFASALSDSQNEYLDSLVRMKAGGYWDRLFGAIRLRLRRGGWITTLALYVSF